MRLFAETGIAGGKLSPAGTTTRAEIAQVPYNLLVKSVGVYYIYRKGLKKKLKTESEDTFRRVYGYYWKAERMLT